MWDTQWNRGPPASTLTASTSDNKAARVDELLVFSFFSHSPDVLLASQEVTSASNSQPGGPYSCVPPTPLYSPSSMTPANTLSNPRVVGAGSDAGLIPPTVSTSIYLRFRVIFHFSLAYLHTTRQHDPLPPRLLSKPFRCPKANCNKSYKQANGLKYHMMHGSAILHHRKIWRHCKLFSQRRESSSMGMIVLECRSRKVDYARWSVRQNVDCGRLPVASTIVSDDTRI